jgi:replication factor C subunit 3/5
MEKYTKSTRFIIICNYVNKIIPALQSRCTKFRFAPLNKDSLLSKLTEIAEIEK